MKALSILLLAMLVLAGCATNTEKMSEEDRLLWETEPSASGSPAK